ncbi:DUF58 domain-containing protein [Kaarinaea lacus]
MILNTRVNNFRRVYLFNRWLHQRFTPLGKIMLVVVVISGVMGLDTTRSLSYQIFSLSAALIIIAILYSIFSRIKLDCERRLPPLATLGQPIQYHVTINNQSNKNQNNVLLIDNLVDNFPGKHALKHYHDAQSQSENWFDRAVGYPRWSRLTKIHAGAHTPMQNLPTIPGKQQIDVPVSLTPLRRGYLQFSSMTLASPDPVGLFRHFKKRKHTDKILVLPKRYSIPKLNLPGKRHHNPGGVALASAIGESSEFHGLRDYLPGDPIRHIHWRSWARTGTPVVKKYEDEFFVRHALILDTYTENNDPQVFEEAVSVAASLALHIDDQESLLDLMFVENQAYHFTTGRHVDGIQSMLEILACVQPEYGASVAQLELLVQQHAALLSSAICILLNWDASRQAFVKTLKDLGIEVVVIVISNQPAETTGDTLGSMTNCPQQFFWLQTDKIESGLSKLAQLGDSSS